MSARGASDSSVLHLPMWDASMSRAELSHLAETMSKALVAAGANDQDVVAIAMTNSVDFVVSFLGVSWCRCVVLPLNPVNKEDEFYSFLEDADVKYLLLAEDGHVEAEKAAKRNGTKVIKVNVSLGKHFDFQLKCFLDGSEVTPDPNGALRSPKPTDKVLILHTSGTTGKPKCVPHTHLSLCAALRNVNWTYDMCEEVSLQVMPLFHPHGLTQGTCLWHQDGLMPTSHLFFLIQRCLVCNYSTYGRFHSFRVYMYRPCLNALSIAL